MSYLSLLEKFNKTDSCFSRGEFLNFQLFSALWNGNGKLFSSKRLSFCAVGLLVSRFRCFGDNRSPNVITNSALDRSAVLPSSWQRSRVRFIAHLRKYESEVFRKRDPPVPGDGSAMRKKGKRTAEVGLGREKKKESLEISRHMLDGTSRLSPERTRGTSVTPARLTPFGCSRGEIQIYAPTAPGVFFELMKNESGGALSPPPFPASPFPVFRPKLEASLNPLYTLLTA